MNRHMLIDKMWYGKLVYTSLIFLQEDTSIEWQTVTKLFRKYTTIRNTYAQIKNEREEHSAAWAILKFAYNIKKVVGVGWGEDMSVSVTETHCK